VKIMVCGGISRYGKTVLHVVPDKETVTGDYYRAHILPIYTSILKDRKVFPNQELAVLMQDEATSHTAARPLMQIDNVGVKVCTEIGRETHPT